MENDATEFAENIEKMVIYKISCITSWEKVRLTILRWFVISNISLNVTYDNLTFNVLKQIIDVKYK